MVTTARLSLLLTMVCSQAWCEGIAATLEVETSAINIKAKTGEGVDAVGESRAVKAQAIVMLAKT